MKLAHHACTAANKLGITGQALHAGELTLIHPVTGENMTFYAPLPEEFENALALLRKRSASSR